MRDYRSYTRKGGILGDFLLSEIYREMRDYRRFPKSYKPIKTSNKLQL